MGICHLFVGPSAFGLGSEAYPEGVVIHEPVQRGFVGRLASTLRKGDVVAIADGVFGRVSSVGHREILSLLDDGFEVYGLCSMGAIRACEMDRFGMRGFGKVYEYFAAAPNDVRDDEVALLHAPMPPYLPISEPLIHLRSLLNELLECGKINGRAASKVGDELSQMWFGYRTLSCFQRLLENQGVHAEEARNVVNQIVGHRLKQLDLKDFLRSKCWENA